MHIQSDNSEISPAVSLILDDYRGQCDPGIRLNIQKGESFCVSLKSGVANIQYSKRVEVFRGLGILLENCKNGDFEKREKNKFDTVGAMIDVSRNAVLTVESVKRLIRYMAVMGLNRLMLYTEDTYTVPEKPYFGYMRGRYSFDEIKAIDDYAYMFGIELVPCIQTLGHMEQYLKWEEAAPAKDTSGVLLVGADETYSLVEQMIKAAAAPVRSKNIHIGMDEAWDIGLGKYLADNGYRRRFDILSEHLKRVVEITEKLDLNPMIWSDMYFRLGSKTGEYYDLECDIPEDIIKEIPDIGLIYWDYYHDDYEFYDTFIKKHKELGRKTIFAGHVWTWSGFLPDYDVTASRFKLQLGACAAHNVKDVFATLWGDDGCETNYFLSLLGLQMYAEYAYSQDEPAGEQIKKRFEFVTGADYNAFMDFSKFHYIKPNTEPMGKKYLHQDILMGLADYELYEEPASGHYYKMAGVYKEYTAKAGKWSEYYKYAYRLFDTVALKCDIAENLRKAYHEGNKEYLEKCANELLPVLSGKVKDLRETHRAQWHGTFKPFGWEVIDIRYSGIIGRIDSAVYRIREYLSGNIGKLEELEEARLKYNGNLASNMQYRRQASATLNF